MEYVFEVTSICDHYDEKEEPQFYFAIKAIQKNEVKSWSFLKDGLGQITKFHTLKEAQQKATEVADDFIEKQRFLEECLKFYEERVALLSSFKNYVFGLSKKHPQYKKHGNCKIVVNPWQRVSMIKESLMNIKPLGFE